MRKIFIFILTFTFSIGAFAGPNTDQEDKIFNEPTKGGPAQLLIGTIESLFAIRMLSSSAHIDYSDLRSAQEELTRTRKLFTTAKDKENAIKAVLHSPRSYEAFHVPSGNANKLTSEAALRLETLRATPVVSTIEKSELLAAAEKSLSNARAGVIAQAQQTGLISKTIRVLRTGTSILLVLDVLGRAYVWNALDANPTFSPAATLIMHWLSQDEKN